MSRAPVNRARIAAVLYAVALTIVSLLPSGRDTLGGWDSHLTPTIQNVLHVPAYTGLLVLVCLAFKSPPGASLTRLFVIALLCGGFGVVLEIAQLFVPGRTGSVIDILLNLTGIALGAAIALSWRRSGRTTKVSVEGLL